MKKNRYCCIAFALTLLLSSTSSWGRTTKESIMNANEKMGGVCYAYPFKGNLTSTALPKGYHPFYISHYGRHGSRYLINEKCYPYTLRLFEDARIYSALTPLGLDVCSRLEKLWPEVDGRTGDLTDLGTQQHQQIAKRMFASYPDVFNGKTQIEARSSTVQRCILSMSAFCDELKGLNTNLVIKKDVSSRYMTYLDFEGKHSIAVWNSQPNNEYPCLTQCKATPERLIGSLFKDPHYVLKKVDAKRLMWYLYWIAEDMQNVKTKVSFFDIFTKDEMFNMWQSINYTLYRMDGPGGNMPQCAKPLLDDFLKRAQSALASKRPSVSLRFGHDTDIIPFTAFLRFQNCCDTTSNPLDVYKVWDVQKITPMAANIQFVFFRKEKSDDVLVKVLLNEKETKLMALKSDIYPYYHWKDMEAYWESLLAK